MKELIIRSSSHRYPVYIGEDLRLNIKKYIKKPYSSIMIITDDLVVNLYAKEITEQFSNERVYTAVIPSGEPSKNIDTYYKLQTKALEKGLDRHSLIIALGGGVVGDLAGFVAATFMRGIDYIQVPTTILAHDSSVGGKVAINHELGKNMIGNFYSPAAVIFDVNTLHTLNAQEIRSGYAELVKEALIHSEDFFNQLMHTDIYSGSNEALADHLLQGIHIKAQIVEADERESGERKFLNLGHTLAHALEAELGYGKIAHGEAVAIGLLFAMALSEKLFDVHLPYNALYKWLQKQKYPLTLENLSAKALIEHMKKDKKAVSDEIQMVFLQKVGKPIVKPITEAQLKYALNNFMGELKEND